MARINCFVSHNRGGSLSGNPFSCRHDVLNTDLGNLGYSTSSFIGTYRKYLVSSFDGKPFRNVERLLYVAPFWRKSRLVLSGIQVTESDVSSLSAYLFEATSDPKYRTAADLSASFVKSQLFNDTGGILMASMSLDPRIDSCHKYPVTQVSTLGSCFEGLSVYANVTGSTGWAALCVFLQPDILEIPDPDLDSVHNMVATTLKYPKLSLLPNGILIHSRVIISNSWDCLAD